MVIGVVNQKGGTGKSTIATNIAAHLADLGKHVLLVDADPQTTALDWAAVRNGTEPHVFVVGLPTRKGVLPTAGVSSSVTLSAPWPYFVSLPAASNVQCCGHYTKATAIVHGQGTALLGTVVDFAMRGQLDDSSCGLEGHHGIVYGRLCLWCDTVFLHRNTETLTQLSLSRLSAA